MERLEYFEEFLNWYWLRPENAILTTIRAEAYYSTLRYFGDGNGTVDISCGDGVFSFLTMGGKLSKSTDMYRAITTEQTFRSVDYDAYDYFDETYFIKIKNVPEYSYEFGTDWKKNLLKKAEKLNFYSSLKEHDNNYALPFNDESMNYVYSNSAYWVENIEGHIRDIVRITRSGGYIVLEMKVDQLKEVSSDKYLPFMGRKFHNIIDAGRFSTWKGLPSKGDILKILNNIDEVDIERFDPIYGDIIAKIWDIGLRPLFNPLAKMTKELPLDKRTDIKIEWCNIILELFADFVKNYKSEGKNVFEYLILLKKR